MFWRRGFCETLYFMLGAVFETRDVQLSVAYFLAHNLRIGSMCAKR